MTNLRGTAFIKKFDMYLDLLNSEKTNFSKNETFLKYAKKSLKKRNLALKCLNSSYSILKTEKFQIFIEEKIIKKNANFEIKLNIRFSNLEKIKKFILNFNLLSKSKYIKIEKNITPFNLEISPYEQISKKITIFISENYLLEFSPIFFNFCKLDKNEMNLYLNGKNPKIVEENIKQFIFPLSINKLLIYKKEPNFQNFQFIENLKKIGVLEYDKNIKLSKEDVFFIFPNIKIFQVFENFEEFGVKILSVYGTNFLKVFLYDDGAMRVEMFSMYETPVNLGYCDTMKFILENF